MERQQWFWQFWWYAVICILILILIKWAVHGLDTMLKLTITICVILHMKVTENCFIHFSRNDHYNRTNNNNNRNDNTTTYNGSGWVWEGHVVTYSNSIIYLANCLDTICNTCLSTASTRRLNIWFTSQYMATLLL